MLSRGHRFERAALRYLRKQGLDPVTSNYRCRAGEIDLVMREGQCLVFVEVRFRASQRFGGGAASVDARKRQRVARTASMFLQSHPALAHCACRFDVVSISGQGRAVEFNWIRSAFDVPEAS